MMSDWSPKMYYNDGRTLEWEESISPNKMAALGTGEIFTLLRPNGTPHSIVLMDSYDTIREGQL